MTGTPRSRSDRSGMSTAELKAFTEMQTTLQMSSQNTAKALDTIAESMKEITARLDRMDARWDERIRVVEASAIECKAEVKANKDDIYDLKNRSDQRDWIAYVVSGVAAAIGMFINPTK